jgi:hypothetical protein
MFTHAERIHVITTQIANVIFQSKAKYVLPLLMAGRAVPSFKRVMRQFFQKPRLFSNMGLMTARASADLGYGPSMCLQKPLSVGGVAGNAQRRVPFRRKVLRLGIMGAVAAKAVSLFHG